MNTRLSVITPILNGVHTIERCVQSVLNQSAKEIEHILVDGGSTDGTLDLLKKYNPEKVKVLSDSDHGIYDAMNRGLKVASGEWVIFIGGNDYLASPNVIEEILNLEQESVDILLGSV